MLTYLGRKVVPEVIALMLSPGTHLPPRQLLLSRRGLARLEVSWHVVELWTLPAEELLAANDVGLVPWVPLAKFDGPAEPILEQCRERIDQQATAEERTNLLAVTQFLMRLRYDEPGLFGILGGGDVMIESPLVQEIVARKGRKDVLVILEDRFGPVPADVKAALEAIEDEDRLTALMKVAWRCESLDAFRTQLAGQTPA
jgi:hypothetical protein